MCALLVLFTQPHTAQQTAASSTARRVLEIAAEDETEPWSRSDGTGSANDVVRAAFKAVDVDVSFRVVPYARCKTMVIDGTVVACFSMSRTGLDSGVIFPVMPLFICYADYYVRADRAAGSKPFDRLAAGTVVGVVRGYEYPASVYSLERQGAIVLEESPSEVTNLKKLVAGRIGAAIINHNETKRDDYVVAQAGAMGKVRRSMRAGTLNSFIGFSRNHPDTKWALERFNAGFLAIVNNGELKRIEQRWATAAR